jgi:hypothetical protein
VDDLVVGALEEGGVDRDERPVALGGEPGREGDRVLLAMPTSKQRSGKRFANRPRPVPDGMAAVIATTLGSASPSLTRASPNTCV